jgi:hypothetical protein
VDVLGEGIRTGLAGGAARANDRYLALEAHVALEDERHTSERRERGREVGRAAQQTLPAAVIPETARLEHSRQADRSGCGLEPDEAVHGAERRCRDAKAAEQLLLVEPVLRDPQRLDRRMTGHRLRYPRERSDRHVLELVGDDVATVGETRDALRIVERAGDDRRDLTARGIGARIEEAEAERQRIAGDRQHAPELAGADDDLMYSQACVGRALRACSVWAAQASSAARTSACAFARIAAASSAALTAPAGPIASVPTGTPVGICTIESSESRPLSVFDCTGTPSTGSDVLAAHMPGRCAAPPAPAMMTLRPRSRAVEA